MDWFRSDTSGPFGGTYCGSRLAPSYGLIANFSSSKSLNVRTCRTCQISRSHLCLTGMPLLTLTPIDGPSVCLWPITAVPQVGQNFISLASHEQTQIQMQIVNASIAPCGPWSPFQNDSPSVYRRPSPLQTDHLTRERPKGIPSIMGLQSARDAMSSWKIKSKNVDTTFVQMLQSHLNTSFSSGSRTENLKAPQWQLP